ncbi:hypothetical protein D3C84_691490 [compost metagenome]
MLRKGFPGVIAQAFSVGVEHHAGDHEFDPGRAVDQPFAQGLLLLFVENAPVAGRQVASGPAVSDKPFDIPVGELIPIALQVLTDVSIFKQLMGRAMAGLI